jgi:hypothetical protein
MAEEKEFDFLKELPAPPKEKIARWGFYAGAAAIAVGAVNLFFPSIIGAGELLVQATWTFIDFGVGAVVLGAGYVGIKNFWPVFQDGVELAARRTAYGLLRQMPTEALDLWIEEVEADRMIVYNGAQSVAAVMAGNEAKISEYNRKAEKAQQSFKAASTSPKFGPNSDEAIDASRDAEHFYNLVEELHEIAGPLSTLYGWLEENARVADAALKEAKRDVEASKVKWEVALETEKGINAGLRGLMGGSRRKANADAAFDIIHKKYAGNFGKIRSMRRLTREVFSKQNLNDAVSLQKAVDRLSAESKLLLGHSAPVPQLEFAKKPTAVPAGGSIRLFDEADKN